MLVSTENPMLSTADTNETLLFRQQDEPQSPAPENTPERSRSRDNKNILIFTSVLFFLFVIAEVVGAFASGSLSLVGDASAMSIDVFSVSSLYSYQAKAFGNLLNPPHIIYIVHCQHVRGKIESRRRSAQQTNSDYP